MTDKKLKPCPFCGSTNLSIRGINIAETWIECVTCGIEQPLYDTEEEAINAWNTRTDKKPICMPGDKVYQLSDGAVYENTVQQIIYDCGHIAFAEGAIGRHIFLTSEAAEKAGGGNDA